MFMLLSFDVFFFLVCVLWRFYDREALLLNFEIVFSGLRLFASNRVKLTVIFIFENSFVTVLIFQMGPCWFGLFDSDISSLSFRILYYQSRRIDCASVLSSLPLSLVQESISLQVNSLQR